MAGGKRRLRLCIYASCLGRRIRSRQYQVLRLGNLAFSISLQAYVRIHSKDRAQQLLGRNRDKSTYYTDPVFALLDESTPTIGTTLKCA